jgi:hypothetical protein
MPCTPGASTRPTCTAATRTTCFTVKRNQPTLHAALAGLPWAQVERQVRRQTGHGRAETRSIAVLAADGAGGIDDLFPHAAQVIRVIRTRTDRTTGKRSREVVYAVTCLDHRCADPGLLAGWLQGHWGIENRIHHVRDITHGEDASRIRTGTGPQLMAALRTTDLNLARLRGETNIAASQRRNAWAGSTAADTATPHDQPRLRRSGRSSGTMQRPCEIDTPIWQLATLPSVPEYCRATPGEAAPSLGKPVSSTTQASGGTTSMARRASRARTGSTAQVEEETNCCNPW